MENNNIHVSSEIGRLRRLIIHSPDGGIGKIIPSKFEDWLYDDTVNLKKMRKEYDAYIKTLLYFLDPEKMVYIREWEAKYKNKTKRPPCFKPGAKNYFNSDKVLDTQQLLCNLLKKKHANGKRNIGRLRLISAICAVENCSYEIQEKLEGLDSKLLARVLITGFIPENKIENEKAIFLFPPTPNFVFTRDIAIVINDHILLSKPAKKARKRESILTRFIALNFLFETQPENVVELVQDSQFFLLEDYEKLQNVITLEGGDVMMIAHNHLIIGCSERTSANAVNATVHKLFSRPEIGIEKVSVVKIPKNRAQMHIDTIFTQVKRNVWVLHGQFSERVLAQRTRDEKKLSYLGKLLHKEEKVELDGVEILEFHKSLSAPYRPEKDYLLAHNEVGLEGLLRKVSRDYGFKDEDIIIIYSGNNEFPYDDREQWTDSCNVLALKEGVVIGYDRNDKTIKAFQENGFEAITTKELFKRFENGVKPDDIENTLILLPSGELSRGRGGSHCMSMPLLRDDW
ncbi:MAG: arginine deiminase family protein [Chitinophagales bacterium]